MSSNALATMGDLDWSVIDDVVAKGDLSKLTVEQRTKYYRMFCESLKLNPVTQPFQYMSLNGKLVLYATKGAADQLRNINHISLSITAAEVRGDDFCVTVRATTPGGRYDEDFASVTIAGLRGEQYHNAKLKAITKAKRRVTLSICGLGVNDETEVVTIPNARLLTPEELEEGIPPIREIRPAPAPVEQPVRATVLTTPRTARGKAADAQPRDLSERDLLNRKLWARAIAYYGTGIENAKEQRDKAREALHQWATVSYPEAVNEAGEPSIAALTDAQIAEMVTELEQGIAAEAASETPIEGETSDAAAE